MELQIRQAEENEIAELMQYDRHIAAEKRRIAFGQEMSMRYA